MSAERAPRFSKVGRSTSSFAAVMAIAFGTAAAGCMGAGVGGGEPDASQPGSGGATTSSGGAPGSGGATTSSGGAPGSGGATTSSGGAPGSGGARSGGATGSGGAPGSGGARSGGATGSGGASNSGGATGSGGSNSGGAMGTGGARTGGASGTGGARTGGAPGTGGAGTGGTTVSAACTWPTPSGSPVSLSASMKVSGSFDGGMKRYVGTGNLGGTGQQEGQDPLFDLAAGATLSNVIIGSPAADGVHCAGACTLKNVWWEDVGEDAATSRGSSSSQVMTIDGGGAKGADDKVFQHNGAGTIAIKNFCVQDFGKLYRSCGNCSTQYARHVTMENVKVIPRSGSAGLAGVNSNYNDTATFKNIIVQAKTNGLTICQKYTGNSSGDEPTTNGSGADGKTCVYQPTDIIWTQ